MRAFDGETKGGFILKIVIKKLIITSQYTLSALFKNYYYDGSAAQKKKNDTISTLVKSLERRFVQIEVTKCNRDALFFGSNNDDQHLQNSHLHHVNDNKHQQNNNISDDHHYLSESAPLKMLAARSQENNNIKRGSNSRSNNSFRDERHNINQLLLL